MNMNKIRSVFISRNSSDTGVSLDNTKAVYITYFTLGPEHFLYVRKTYLKTKILNIAY